MFTRTLTGFVLLAAALSNGALLAQTPDKDDDAVKKLFEKIDKENGEKPKPPAAEKKEDALSAKDQEIDALLGKYADTPDEPDAKGKPSSKPDAAAAKKPGDQNLKPEDKTLDDELERILGRKKKPKNQDESDDSSNPLGQTVKKMREVEKRLEKPDTGEQTREKQGQIVKDLDQLLEMIRQGKMDGSGRKTLRRVAQAGKQPGGQPGQNPNQGNQGGNAPFTKPNSPKKNDAIARSKDVWGELQAELRAEVDNVVNEQPLPAKRMLIERYLLSVSKKSLSRGNSE